MKYGIIFSLLMSCATLSLAAEEASAAGGGAAGGGGATIGGVTGTALGLGAGGVALGLATYDAVNDSDSSTPGTTGTTN